MKQRIVIIGALLLLLVVFGLILKDLFFDKPESNNNPYDYDLGSLKKGDSLLTLYQEDFHFTPVQEEIRGIAIDNEGRIAVTGNKSVELYDATGKELGSFSVPQNAGCITTDETGNFYIGVEDHLEVYDRTGILKKKWNPANEKSLITAIAVTTNSIYVADAVMKVVYHYEKSGKMVCRIGEKDPENKIPGFVIPSPYFDLGLGRSGELWVVNPGRHTLSQFTPEGKITSTWGIASMAVDGFCGCCNPSHFAVLSDGSFVTSEKGLERIKIYGHDGTFLGMVATPDQFEEGTQGLDLAVDNSDRILVLDPVRKQIRFFTKKRLNP